MLQKKHIICIPLVVGIVVRLVFYILFCGTMFRHYHMVSGLDMQTLLRFSEWGKNLEVPPFFTLHRIVVYALWKLNDGIHPVNLLYLIQSAFGIVGALATADIVLMLTGKRKAALAAGVLYALYLPFLIYEFSVLQETFTVNTMLFAIWSVFYARKKGFSLFSSIVAGTLCGLTLTGRPTAILATPLLLLVSFVWCRKKRVLKRYMVMIAAAAAVIAGASIFNMIFNGGTGPLYNAVTYTVQYNTAATDMDNREIKPAALLKTIGNMLVRTPMMLSARELPENQNLYFWRYKLPETRMLIGPEILITITIFGICMIFFGGKWRKKEGILLLLVILLAPLLCAREPIGRYRLMLCPLFIMLSVIGFTLLPSFKGRRRLLIGVAFFAAISATVIELHRNHGLRTSDFHSWALATEAGSGNTEDTLDAFYEYWQRSAMSGDRAFCAMQGAAMRASRMDVAATVIRQAELTGKVNRSLIGYYTGLIFVGRQDPQNVMRAFAHIKPDELPPDLRKNYYMVLNDTVRFLKQPSKQQLNKAP